jgi:hypothetical protein
VRDNSPTQSFLVSNHDSRRVQLDSNASTDTMDHKIKLNRAHIFCVGMLRKTLLFFHDRFCKELDG